MTTSSDGVRRRINTDARFTIRGLSDQFARDKRTSDEALIRAALAEAYSLGYEDGINSQKETANGFPQA